MQLDDLRQNWETFGAENPMWAIYTGRGRIEWDEGEFFATGDTEISEVMAVLERHGAPSGAARALDFGCGLGRLSQALAAHYETVDGVDISEPMIEGAKVLARQPTGVDESRLRYHLNTKADLSIFEDESFDLVFSLITLQHMRPEFSRSYIAEFCRLVRPGGVVFFQLPTHRTTALKRLRGAAGRTMRKVRRSLLGGEPVMEMYGTPRKDVEALLTTGGLRVLDVLPDELAGPSWQSFRYLAIRPDSGD